MPLNLSAPAIYQELTTEQKAVICNGMGAKDSILAKLIPNTMYLLDVTEAGNIHDFMYHMGKSEEDKTEADRTFLINMLQIINSAGGWLAPLRRLRALKYYEAVYYYGDSAFWASKLD